jgi:hypothetical protein
VREKGQAVVCGIFETGILWKYRKHRDLAAEKDTLVIQPTQLS